MKHLFISILIFCSLFANNLNERVITIGGCVTETVFALEMGQNVVAVDISSSIPNKVTQLPQVGYIRGISTEGILSMNPDKILTTTEMGPPKVVQQLKDAGINLKIFNAPKNYDDILSLIDDVATFLDVSKKGEQLKSELIELNNQINELKLDKPKIAFFMSPALGSYNAAGSGTRADYLINYIGGENIFTNDFKRYTKVSKEDIIKYNPDIILTGYVRELNKKEVVDIFKNSDEFQSVAAIKNNQLYGVSVGEVLNFGPSFVNTSLNLITKINTIE
tara:strand:- start:820 stop:1650 length:831 start_codon:yes stop_codon:yes gene_type:complete